MRTGLWILQISHLTHFQLFVNSSENLIFCYNWNSWIIETHQPHTSCSTMPPVGMWMLFAISTWNCLKWAWERRKREMKIHLYNFQHKMQNQTLPKGCCCLQLRCKITRNSSPFTFIASLRASPPEQWNILLKTKVKQRKNGRQKLAVLRCVCRAWANTLSGELRKT